MPLTPRVAAIHDLSGFGRCSLTIVSPCSVRYGSTVLSYRHRLSIYPYGGLFRLCGPRPDRLMEATIGHWKELGLTFSGVYSGFMASEEQMKLATQAIDTLKGPGGVTVVDPVMGDHGRRYATYTQLMCEAMGALCAQADVITPNLTEAAFLLDLDYASLSGGGKEGLELARALSEGGRRSVVLTGVSSGEGMVGAACYDRASGRAGLVMGSTGGGRVPWNRGYFRLCPHWGAGGRNGAGAGCRPGRTICFPVCGAHPPAGLPTPGRGGL